MKLRTTALLSAVLASGCTLNSPFLQPDRSVQVQTPAQPLQPIIINQMPSQPVIERQLVQRHPNGQQIVVMQQESLQEVELTDDEKIDQNQVRVLMQMAEQTRATPVNSMTIPMIQKAHNIERELGLIHAKYVDTDRGPAFLYEPEQLDEPIQPAALSQSELNYLTAKGVQ